MILLSTRYIRPPICYNMLLYPIIAHTEQKTIFTDSLPYTASVPRVAKENPSPVMTLPSFRSHPFELYIHSELLSKSPEICLDSRFSGQFFPFYSLFNGCARLATLFRYFLSAEKGKIGPFLFGFIPTSLGLRCSTHSVCCMHRGFGACLLLARSSPVLLCLPCVRPSGRP